MLTVGSLFTGYGGLDLAVEDVFGARTVWTSDHDPTVPPAKHGPGRIIAERFPDAPNLGDITAIDWSAVPPVDIVTGGFPCQDVSAAGRRAGLRPGTRTGLWSHMVYAVDQLRPQYMIAENVRGLTSADAHSDVEPCPVCLGDRPGGHLRALGAVLADLADIGYDAQWCGLRAADVGAPHGRFRIFLVATDTRQLPGTSGRLAGPGEASGGWPLDQSPRRDREPELLGTPRAAEGMQYSRRKPADIGNPRGRLEDQVALLPTPDATHGRKTTRTGLLLPGTVELLPTPRATDGTKGGPNQHGSAGDLMLPSAVHRLLPTPSAADGLGGHERRGGTRGDELLLGGVAKRLLPTPTVVDSNGGRNATANRSPDAAAFNPGWTLWDVAYVDRFGEYADAVGRWEPIIGWQAPDPTVRGRLSPLFVEWMMGLPAGWVSDVAGLSRAQQLKALGNGVVPQQAAAALAYLCEVAVSHD